MNTINMIIHGVVAIAVLGFCAFLVTHGGSSYSTLVGALAGAVVTFYFTVVAMAGGSSGNPQVNTAAESSPSSLNSPSASATAKQPTP